MLSGWWCSWRSRWLPSYDFLNNRAEERKPYISPLTNPRFNGHIFRKTYEDGKDEWNNASIFERQAI